MSTKTSVRVLYYSGIRGEKQMAIILPLFKKPGHISSSVYCVSL